MDTIKLTSEQIKEFGEYIADYVADSDNFYVDRYGYFDIDTLGDEGYVFEGLDITFKGNGRFNIEHNECSGEFWGTPCTEEWDSIEDLASFYLEEICICNEDGDVYEISKDDYTAICEIAEK